MTARPGGVAPLSEDARRRRATWSPRDTVALAAVTLAAGLIRFARFTTPRGLVFDEFYAADGCLYVLRSPAQCRIDHEISVVHPPLGKWLIGIGVRVFGFGPGGWRIASVVAGTLTVLVVYVLGRKLLRSTAGATMAAGLMAFDFLHFVLSRTAMLDVFLVFFSVCAFTCLAFDRDRLLSPLHNNGAAARGELGRRRWRLAAGLAAGAAAACKWSGWYVVVAVIVVTVTWEVAARRRPAGDGALAAALREEGLSILVGLMIIPVAVYTVSYVGVLDGSLLAWPWAPGSWVRAFMDRQVLMAHHHLGPLPTHPYMSPAWSWPLIKRPVLFYYLQAPQGLPQEILAMGSPLTWWASLVALAHLAVRWGRRRGPTFGEGVILAGFIASYAPWLVLSRQEPFLYYMLPAVPFMCLALAKSAVIIGRWRAGKALTSAFAVGALALFVFYYPLLTAMPLSRDAREERLLFRDCAQSQAQPEFPGAGTSAAASTGLDPITKPGPPPAGWCWA